MRIVVYAALSLVATLPLSAETPNGPVQGAVQGTVKGTATSVARGAGQATVGVARGVGTVATKTGKGAWCIVTLGYGC